MASLDDIWDAPAEPSLRSKPFSPARSHGGGDFSPPPTKRPSSSRPLFFDSGSEDESNAPSKSRYASKPASNKPDIDAFFADLDDDPDAAFQDLAPSLDVAALKAQADAKLALTPHQILPSSSPPREMGDEKEGDKGKAGDKKGNTGAGKRKKRPVLDETRLISPDGFPALMKQAKDFKPKGKGHELQDLTRLMNVYQFWTHKMHPNTQFLDTVQRVEKLCHSKRMHIALSVWRDEAKGLINGHKIPGSDDSDSDSDNEASKNARLRDGQSTKGQSEEPQDVPVATDDDRSARGGSLPPSSPSSASTSLGALDDDFDIDAMIREEEHTRAQPAASSSSRPPPTAVYGAPRPAASEPADEDEAMWDAMDDFPDGPYVPPERPQPPAPPPASSSGGGAADEDMDEDMWDMVREMEAEEATTEKQDTTTRPVPPSVPTDSQESAKPAGPAEGSSGGLTGADPTRKATNDDGWDEMYA
ncbi:replication fork protection component Swi3-domain-containing protein [Trametes elegans]|nr:replication fork protection component Swi3-domain-containing protein [Trametes elegans]